MGLPANQWLLFNPGGSLRIVGMLHVGPLLAVEEGEPVDSEIPKDSIIRVQTISFPEIEVSLYFGKLLIIENEQAGITGNVDFLLENLDAPEITGDLGWCG
jgi:hypothetical protein